MAEREKCQHEYKILDYELVRHYALEETDVYLVAYCKKCLDVQVIDKEIKNSKGIDE